MAEIDSVEKPIRAVVDDWIRISDKAGISLKMYESGTVVIEHKVYDTGTHKYRLVSKLVLPWEAVEQIRQNYKRYKAIKDGQSQEPKP
jgi:hypothetical protein